MEVLSTAEAAALVGVNVQKFHRLAAKYGVEHVYQVPARSGSKLWNQRDVDRIRRAELECHVA